MPRDVRQFIVGDGPDADFSKDYIEKLIYKVGIWFAGKESDRDYDNPLEVAKEKVKQCLLAETDKGGPWVNAPPTLAARIRSKCHFDIDTDQGIKYKKPKGRRTKFKAAEKSAKELDQVSVTATVSNFDQELFRRKVEHDILKEFPELDNPAHRPNVRRLSLVYAQQEIIDRELALAPRTKLREDLLKQLRDLEAMAQNTLKVLGIHPDQIRKGIGDHTSGSVAELISLLEDDKEFKERQKAWSLQLALQLYWMTQHPNGRGDGPQLHEWEMWHMTRTRPIHFVCEHGTEYLLIEGFKPEELRDYLVQNGVLVEQPLIPDLIPEKALAGLGSNSWRAEGKELIVVDERGKTITEGVTELVNEIESQKQSGTEDSTG